MLIEANDFSTSHLKVKNNFLINNENAIYLGPNGIGKTTTYNIMKSKYSSFGFFSYDDCKEKITKEKKKIRIDIRTVDIEKLKKEKDEILNEIDIKNNGFKVNGITSSTKAGEYSNYCKEAYNNVETAIINFDDKNSELLFNYPQSTKKNFLFQNIENISKLILTGEEINDIKNKFILEAFDLLEKALDDNDTMCPLCGYNHNSSILEIYSKKKVEYTDKLNKIIDKYRIESKKKKYEIEADIKELIKLVEDNKLDEKDITNCIIIGSNLKKITVINEARKRINEINKQIKKLEFERKEFFGNLMNNWDKIEKDLKDVFKEKGITFSIDEEEKCVIVNLKRDASTYSSGELNYIVFIINILEFEYSNRTNIVIDDPLSSYDIKKQYEIVFDIFTKLLNKEKKVIILTHNINFINIANSQFPNKFNYYFLDAIDYKITIAKISIETDGSVLNIEDLAKKIPDSELEKKWIDLLIEKDLKWDETNKRHKLFHFDEEYTDPISGYSNLDLVKMIDEFITIKEDDFEIMSAKKILYLTATRVWIEKKLTDNYTGKLHGNQLFPKIRNYFKNKDKWKKDLGIKKEDLTRRKVLLNQNDHYKSQIIPFQYALSISTDELINDINEIKKLF